MKRSISLKLTVLGVSPETGSNNNRKLRMGRHKFYYIFCRVLMLPFNYPYKIAKS
jgi:hypothetical protein